MEINRVGTQPSVKGPPEWFTGTVRIDPLFQAPDPALVQGASVTFEPGARTVWAHASARSDSHRDGRLRLGAARRRTDRGDPAR
jgi:quercetin dioxygenase-like cupin family protein